VSDLSDVAELHATATLAERAATTDETAVSAGDGERDATDPAATTKRIGGRLGENLVYLLVSQLATWAISLIVLIRVPDQLGTSDWGRFGFSLAFVQFFGLAASLGSSTLLTRTIAREPTLLPTYVYNALVMKFVLAGTLSVGALGLAFLLGKSGVVLVVVALACLGMLLVVVNQVFVGALSGVERFGRPALWAAVQVYLASGLGLLVIAAGGGVVGYATAFALAGIVPMIANGRTVWPWLKGARRVDLGIWRVLVRGGAPLMVLMSLNLVYATIDIPILDSIAGDTTVGWYTLAYRWVAIPIFISTAAVTAFFPSFSAHGTDRSEEFVRLVNRALRLVITMSVPAAVGLAVLADDVRQLFYGAEFEPFVPIVRILALHIPLVAVGMILGMALIASDRQSRYIVVAAFAAVLNPVVGIFAIRAAVDAYDNGAIGAALVTVGTEVFVMCGALAVRSKGVMDGRVVLLGVRVVVAGLAMAGAVILVDTAPIVVRIVVGVTAYAIASMVLRTVTLAEVRRGLGLLAGATAAVRRAARPSVV